jgi:hypothetical protein
MAKEQWRRRRIAWLARHSGMTFAEVGRELGLSEGIAAQKFHAMEHVLAERLNLNTPGYYHIHEEGITVGQMYPFKEETREQAKKRLAAVVRQSYLVLNPGECEDCEEKSSPHRVKCPECTLLVCPYCWHHAHLLVVDMKHLPSAVAAIEQEWDDAEAIHEREMRHWMENRHVETP